MAKSKNLLIHLAALLWSELMDGAYPKPGSLKMCTCATERMTALGQERRFRP
jgi:hypothetical protein